jgi:type I restriction enzyme S subunit
MLGNIRIALPPYDEQRAIARYLFAETGKVDALVAKVEVSIDRLQEYRAALITAAVTGKFDVRSATV